jgi:hypothetical protein
MGDPDEDYFKWVEENVTKEAEEEPRIDDWDDVPNHMAMSQMLAGEFGLVDISEVRELLAYLNVDYFKCYRNNKNVLVGILTRNKQFIRRKKFIEGIVSVISENTERSEELAWREHWDVSQEDAAIAFRMLRDANLSSEGE